MKIAVVGGGIIGLTTASLLRNELPRNAEITIIVENFPSSHAAPGIFRVGSTLHSSEKVIKKWTMDSYDYYDDIRKTYDASVTGVKNISGYIFSSISPEIVQNRFLKSVVPLYRKTTKEELELVNGDWKYGAFFSTLLIECKYYLPWIKEELERKKVTFIENKIKSFKDLLGDFDIIMNCTGFGARKLCNDKNLVAIQGQTHRVKASWIKMFFYGDLNTYVIPGFDTVTLGGTRNYDCEDLTSCHYEYSKIQYRCTCLVPSLIRSTYVEKAVGIRPHREGGIKLEGSYIKNNLAKAIIVHNYGHSGFGITMAPATTMEAISTAIQLHKCSSINSKL